MDNFVNQALITSLRLLASSPKSEAELRKRLTQKGFPSAPIEQALQNLRGKGVLSDENYAQDLLTNLFRIKGEGRRRIAFEMKRRGLSQKTQNLVLSKITEKDEIDKAFEIARNKFASFKSVDEQKQKKRLYDFLMRKGYDFGIAKEVTEKVIKTSKETDNEEL